MLAQQLEQQLELVSSLKSTKDAAEEALQADIQAAFVSVIESIPNTARRALCEACGGFAGKSAQTGKYYSVFPVGARYVPIVYFREYFTPGSSDPLLEAEPSFGFDRRGELVRITAHHEISRYGNLYVDFFAKTVGAKEAAAEIAELFGFKDNYTEKLLLQLQKDCQATVKKMSERTRTIAQLREFCSRVSRVFGESE